MPTEENAAPRDGRRCTPKIPTLLVQSIAACILLGRTYATSLDEFLRATTTYGIKVCQDGFSKSTTLMPERTLLRGLQAQATGTTRRSFCSKEERPIRPTRMDRGLRSCNIPSDVEQQVEQLIRDQWTCEVNLTPFVRHWAEYHALTLRDLGEEAVVAKWVRRELLLEMADRVGARRPKKLGSGPEISKFWYRNSLLMQRRIPAKDWQNPRIIAMRLTDLDFPQDET